ncbi:MAG TPA: Xaa-Pro peptidase family protein [Anaerolineales bacterium]|nr:Xaa-Pro peptidase family protein [Anaerolineales bacterium]
MINDLDNIMREKGIDALLVFGHAENNPPMRYMTGGGHVTHATLIKKVDSEPVLFCGVMERDEAAKSGLKIRIYDEFPWQDYMTEARNDPDTMNLLRYRDMLLSENIEGTVQVYGHYDVGSIYGLLTGLSKLIPKVNFVGISRENSVFNRAMETKSPDQIEAIRKMGKITTQVVGLTADYLTSRPVNQNEELLDESGNPLKLGKVREKINLWMAERGGVPSEGFIFAIGSDAGVPHSQGNVDDTMRLGETIVFDIYPQEPGGGYFYDFTRTWCLGYAKPEALEMYGQVKKVYDEIISSLKVNEIFKRYNEKTNEMFEEMGHPTQRTEKTPQSGYIHSLGHGVGLNIHERPWSGLLAGDDNILKPGCVFTIEPGLYYPMKGMGFRIEDTYCVTPEGKIERLAEFPYDLVLKMKEA